MAVESIGAVLSNPETQTQQTSLGQEDLFEILLTQLTYQDPLKPLDNQEFIAQLAQFTGLEQSRQSNDNLEAMLTMQTANQSIGLLGNTVQVQTDDGGQVGTVTTVLFERGVPKLTVQLSSGAFLNDVSLSQVSLVREGGGASQSEGEQSNV
jgi:flagellar basal-body rod modification protein FlgD